MKKEFFLVVLLVFCLFIPLKTRTEDIKTEEIKEETESNFSLFWQDFKDTLKIFFSWDNVEKTKLVLERSEKKLEEYKKYRAQQKDKLAEKSLKRYQKEIEIILDVLEKESDPAKAEQIAEEVKEKTSQAIIELQELYEQAPEPFRERIATIIKKLQQGYEVSLGIISGEYRQEIQGGFRRVTNWLETKMKIIFHKLWPI